MIETFFARILTGTLLFLLAGTLAAVCPPGRTQAESFGPAIIGKAGSEGQKTTRSQLLPFAFRSDLVGLAVGIVFA
ncbi:hypothetical protein LF599_04050 [Pseudodesulfovibrio thermohalotolerans]|uniref:hypothetical protein n=1 Tax=Pseudodesulfovibrio thermohalotolerans TaxID=2880651 RepID=UPI00244199DC|nr:hypothetical protein [Pseudodesulfovibrio thermohalotolerans]WFS63351.1 hypothetical protein LF599_04050 [Pseudodesulfovibrio thermohalotolerans]